MTIQQRIDELIRLEQYFKSIKLPQPPLVLDGFMTIFGVKTFVETNLSRAVKDNNFSEPCIIRLQRLEKYINDLNLEVSR